MLYHCASVARGLHLSSACVVRSAPRRPQRTNGITRKLSGLGESLGSESPEGWRRAPELLCKPNARGQSVAEGNKLDGTPIGKRTLTRPSRRHFARKAYGPWMESPRNSQGPGKARIPRCAPHPGYKADVAESKKCTRIANRNFSAHRLTCTKRPGGLKMLGVARSKNELL